MYSTCVSLTHKEKKLKKDKKEKGAKQNWGEKYYLLPTLFPQMSH